LYAPAELTKTKCLTLPCACSVCGVAGGGSRRWVRGKNGLSHSSDRAAACCCGCV
jgi:hypothetical protein